MRIDICGNENPSVVNPFFTTEHKIDQIKQNIAQLNPITFNFNIQCDACLKFHAYFFIGKTELLQMHLSYVNLSSFFPEIMSRRKYPELSLRTWLTNFGERKERSILFRNRRGQELQKFANYEIRELRAACCWCSQEKIGRYFRYILNLCASVSI